jgi:hypothetical protein
VIAQKAGKAEARAIRVDRVEKWTMLEVYERVSLENELWTGTIYIV